MLPGDGIYITLREAEVDNVNDLFLAAGTDEEVLRLDVSVDKLLAVEVLHPLNALESEHRDCLLCELAVTELKEGIQCWPKDLHNHDVEVPFPAEVLYPRHPVNVTFEDFVESVLVR